MSIKGIEGEAVALSYHDCLLRNKDVDLLRGPHWLNDAIIGFYFEYLQHKHDDASGENREILFVSPELTQLLKLTDSAEYSAFLEPLNATECSYVLFPLNNCESRDTAGGSHWSLLVYSKKEQISLHLDSCRGTNRSAAAQFSKKIINYLSESGEGNFQETQCPQQDNGYDCGLFIICLADSILRQTTKTPGLKGASFSEVSSTVRTKRDELLNLIEEIKSIQELKK